MAITSVDLALAGMQPPFPIAKAVSGTLVAGRAHSFWMIGGCPGAASAPASGLVGEVLTANVVGQIPYTNPVSGNGYLAYLAAQAAQAGLLLLCDRLWQNSTIDPTSTAEQTFTSSVQIPARDANGSNAGVGVLGAMEVITATGAIPGGAPSITLKYTNSLGTAGQTALAQVAGAASEIIGTFHIFNLAAGDVGIQKAQSITLSQTMTSGTLSVVLFRILAALPISAAQTPNAFDGVSLGFPRIYNSSVPFLVFVPNTTTTTNIIGQVAVTQG